MSDSVSMRWQDAVDVVVLTVVLWKLYGWLRGTIALRILAGVAVVVAGGLAARGLGLVLTSYVLQGLGAVAALVIVVVFQKELRRGLVQADPRAWLRARRAAPPLDDAPAAAVALAAFALARRRLGALIVVPGHDPLDEHLVGGTTLDAEPTAALLEALFQPGSPLHDGAVVLVGGRVRNAGVVLPLSKREVPEAYGTRHRAALGLGEACDAAVVVVSEERGAVGLARAGALEPIADAAGLRARLLALAVPAAPPRRRRLGDVAAIAVIATAVLIAWGILVGGPGAVVTRAVAVEVRNVGDALEVDAPRPAEVRVRLRGPRPLLGDLPPDELAAWIDLADGRQGRRDVPVEVSVPAGVEVVEVVPAMVRVRLREAR